MSKDIYNFVKLDDDKNPDIIIFLTELNDPHENNNLMYIGHKFYNHLITNEIIDRNTLVIISFIKHFSKSIKSLTFIGKSNKSISKFLSLNSLIANFIIKNENKKKLENFIVYEKDNSYEKEISIHSINSEYSLQGYNRYFN